jgi:hypothetical protein
MVVLCQYHSYDVMPLYYWVVLPTFVRVLTKIKQKWRPLVKLYRSVCINGNELHRVLVISWKSTYMCPVSLSASSKTLKHIINLPTTADGHILSTASATNIPTPLRWTHRFCESYDQSESGIVIQPFLFRFDTSINMPGLCYSL